MTAVFDRDRLSMRRRASQRWPSVVEKCHGRQRPGTAAGNPRATSRGRRAEAAEPRLAGTGQGAPEGVSCPALKVHSHELDTDDSFVYKFDHSGTYDYLCGIHPHMHGQVVVEG